MWLCDVAEKNRIMHVPDIYMWSPAKPGDFFIPCGNFKLPQRYRDTEEIQFNFCASESLWQTILPKAKIITVSVISLSAHLPWYLQ